MWHNFKINWIVSVYFSGKSCERGYTKIAWNGVWICESVIGITGYLITKINLGAPLGIKY